MACVQVKDTELFISSLDSSHLKATCSICKIRNDNQLCFYTTAPNSPVHTPKGLTTCLDWLAFLRVFIHSTGWTHSSP